MLIMYITSLEIFTLELPHNLPYHEFIMMKIISYNKIILWNRRNFYSAHKYWHYFGDHLTIYEHLLLRIVILFDIFLEIPVL